MTPTITVTNPPPAAWTPTPGPECVDLRHIPITRTKPPIPARTYPVNKPPRQQRQKWRMR